MVHFAGRGPAYTATRLPVTLAYQESFNALDHAVRRERQLKGWTHEKKACLVSGDLKRLKELAKVAFIKRSAETLA
jgi:predicted GIY-YIG superfamily endonuclease